MKLFYRELGQGKPLMILHGLFGHSDNWQTHAKKLSEYYRVILVDLRNHGRSPWSDDFSYELMAKDVLELANDLGLDRFILLGHSMGGKAAMVFAQQNPERLEKLIVVDIGVKAYPMHHEHILAGINAVGLENITSRSIAEDKLDAHIDSVGVKLFLLKNLYWKDKENLAWRMNVKVLKAEMENILSAVPEIEVLIPTLFIRGEASNYILEDDYDELERYFPDSEIKTIAQAGHWVHAEAPDEFLEAVLAFCLR